jgi:hypothetical protein
VQMRIRKMLSNNRSAYRHQGSEVPCVSEQLAEALARRFRSQGPAPAPGGQAQPTYRLVGHSLGAQLVVQSSRLLAGMRALDPTIR